MELIRTPARQAREEREMVRLMPEQMKERVRGDGAIFSLDFLANTFNLVQIISRMVLSQNVLQKASAVFKLPSLIKQTLSCGSTKHDAIY